MPLIFHKQGAVAFSLICIATNVFGIVSGVSLVSSRVSLFSNFKCLSNAAISDEHASNHLSFYWRNCPLEIYH